MKTKVDETETMGRGVYANRNFRKGQVVEVSHCITWDKETEDHIQNSALRFYVFDNEDGKSCLALGVGSLFNHSAISNVTYKYNKKKKVMTFKASKSIKKGHQLYINYGYNPLAKLKSWEIQKQNEKSEKAEVPKSQEKKPFWDEDKKTAKRFWHGWFE